MQETTMSAHAHPAIGDLEITVDSLLLAVDRHDGYTHDHSLRVSHSSAVVAESLGLGAAAVEVVRDAGLVHDIGKVGIPRDLLRKTGALTGEEFELLSLHPVLGACLLARTPDLHHLVSAVLHHHERWDGRGYPAKLAGNAIPLESRIVFVTDSLDAMTSARPYGKVRSLQDALAELRRCSGRQFDPVVVDAVQDALETGRLAGSEISEPALHAVAI